MKVAGFFLLLGMLASCHRRPALPEGGNARAFYYWRTTFALSDTERKALVDFGISKLYVRLFDVDRSESQDAPQPKGLLEVPPQKAPLPSLLEIVPVVFIREFALRSLDDAAVQLLSMQIWRQMQRRAAAFERPIRELQFDCDWTDGTQRVFFSLLEHIKPLASAQGIQLSSTIRLHQIKYRERTGVPPVSRGMLMFYNMGSIDTNSESQAIFDSAVASKYLSRLNDYPLPLDVALPIWSWVVHIRGEKVVGLMQNTAPETLRNKGWLEPVAQVPNRFNVKETTFLDGVLLREGDVLDVESATAESTLAAAKLVAPRLGKTTKPRTVTLFDLSEQNLGRYDKQAVEKIFSAVP